MTTEPEPAFTALYRPRHHEELMLSKPILDREGVNYYVQNEEAARGTLCAIGEDELTVMVDTRQAERCATILREELGLGSAVES